MKKYLFSTSIVGVVVFVNFLARLWTERFIGREGNIGIGFIRLGIFENYFGLFGLASIGVTVFVTLVVFCFLIYLIVHDESIIGIVAYSLLLAGGINNFCERIFTGRVFDTFSLSNVGFFNVADLAIALGLLLVAFFRIQKEKNF